MAEESRIAVFVDFENLAIGSRDMHEGEFRIDLVQNRLLEKGRIVFKRAYCDWNRYRGAVREFHAQGIEMIDIPSSKMSGKNSADIRMVVDALDLSHAKDHIDVFALLTGDSDFSPLVNKLKENNKRVIGCGVKSSTSELLVSSCDEFIYYDDLVKAAKKILVTTAEKRKPAVRRPRTRKAAAGAKPEAEVSAAVAETAAEKKKPAARRPRTRKRKEDARPEIEPEIEAEAEAQIDAETETSEANEGLARLVAIVTSLAQDYDPVWGSLVKQTLRRVHPDFREERYGYASFVAMLKDAEARGLVALEYDQARGNYKIRIPA
jgi:uncharacterized protein (TIGR00288 family)